MRWPLAEFLPMRGAFVAAGQFGMEVRLPSDSEAFRSIVRGVVLVASGAGSPDQGD